jgi:hypothetical protein
MFNVKDDISIEGLKKYLKTDFFNFDDFVFA